MVAAVELSVVQRLAQLLRHLNIARTHVAARLPADWGGLAATRPEVFASLTLVCPTAIDAEALRPLAARTAAAKPFLADQGLLAAVAVVGDHSQCVGSTDRTRRRGRDNTEARAEYSGEEQVPQSHKALQHCHLVKRELLSA